MMEHWVCRPKWGSGGFWNGLQGQDDDPYLQTTLRNLDN